MEDPERPPEQTRGRGVGVYDRPSGLAALGPRIWPILILILLIAVMVFLLFRYVL